MDMDGIQDVVERIEEESAQVCRNLPCGQGIGGWGRGTICWVQHLWPWRWSRSRYVASCAPLLNYRLHPLPTP
jgi:hypothetical protein